MNNLFYIGLNGYAGAGKDTVAKMLYVILNNQWEDKQSAFEYFNKKYATNIRPYATLNTPDDNMCTCIAFADRVKTICADLFGVPVEYFYYNKSTAWICVNKDFEYTEQQPDDNFIVTAEDYYCCKDTYIHSSNKYYMSLREILVYVGTYICQYNICPNSFVNSINNTINTKFRNNSTLKYIICTDVRFVHEYNFVKKSNGIMINIVRKGLEQAADIAEHSMDMIDQDAYNYVISNNGSYKDLFDTVWKLTHDENNELKLEFRNDIIQLTARDNTRSPYLRKLRINDNIMHCRLCTYNGISKISHNYGQISSIDPQGGPHLFVGDTLYDIYTIEDIIFDETKDEYIIVLSF